MCNLSTVDHIGLFKIKHGTTVSYLLVDWINAGPSRAGGRVFGEGSSCSDRSQSFGQEGHRSGRFVQVVFGFYGSEPNPFLLESSGVAWNVLFLAFRNQSFGAVIRIGVKRALSEPCISWDDIIASFIFSPRWLEVNQSLWIFLRIFFCINNVHPRFLQWKSVKKLWPTWFVLPFPRSFFVLQRLGCNWMMILERWQLPKLDSSWRPLKKRQGNSWDVGSWMVKDI